MNKLTHTLKLTTYLVWYVLAFVYTHLTLTYYVNQIGYVIFLTAVMTVAIYWSAKSKYSNTILFLIPLIAYVNISFSTLAYSEVINSQISSKCEINIKNNMIPINRYDCLAIIDTYRLTPDFLIVFKKGLFGFEYMTHIQLLNERTSIKI